MSAAFDPGKFLAETAPAPGGHFDPGKFLAETAPSDDEGPGKLESGLRGAAQGATFGFADELTGAGGALVDKLKGDKRDLAELYREERDDSRKHYDAAQKANPMTYLGGNVAGALGTALATGGGSLAAEGAGLGARLGAGALNGMAMGAAGGLGSSDADLTKGDVGGAALDTLKGGAIGTGLGVGGALLGAGAQKLGQYAGGKVEAALQKATDLATEKQDALQKSAAGAVGGEAQKGSRMIENLMRLESTGDLDADGQAQLQALRQGGQWKELVQGVAQHNLEDIPNQLNVLKAKKEALAQLMANRDSAIQAEAQRITSPEEAMRQVGERVKRYGPVWAGAVAGKVLGNAETPGALSAMGLRPGIRAVQRMMGAPSVQTAIYGTAGKIASIAQLTPERLGVFGPVLQRALGNGQDSFAATHFILSQSNPQYQQTVQALNDEPQK